ncbi:phosphoribosyltransferase-like protein [Fimicolochytrium jonesii]|uniref:phosphoribosyltransferase-like protein n=1 Tax=Fimicolochytrium jonesii TaxID=1396493 RepID=UPI0022FF3B62|nr:phosphoribosyltransferase-like protein [Fimicolochytrium jonesii]KAI8825749.1 phosphoribosyltransferase-like protein [Fimicolochytrium jonesii]
MCGINGVLLADSSASASAELYEGLGLLQHRGQDAAGIITCGNKGRLYQCKGNGMVRDVFEPRQLVELQGALGVGHVRYPTAGTSSNAEAQPFYVNSPYGIVFAHNGNLTNSTDLRDFLDHEAHRHVNTDSDSELLLNIFADHLNKTGKFRVNEEDIFKALEGVYAQCKGGYACVGMIAGFGLIGFRDPNGIRPLIYGERATAHGTDYMLASESVVLDALGFTNFIDVKPGEAVILTKNGVKKRQCRSNEPFTPDIFEYVYFARPDSIMDGISVYKARLAMGEALAKAVLKELGSNHDIDVVIPVPDTSRCSALQASYKLNILYREGFVKNRYIGRTFIMPGQQQRKKSVRRKLNAMNMEFAGKNVLLVDDSIVRGTTSYEIIQMAREAGAKKVYFASCAPPVRFPNVYGIDMPTRQELVAHNRTASQVAEEIGADRVIYQAIEDLVESVRSLNLDIKQFDISVFNGCYITGDIDEAYLNHLEGLRNDNSKEARQAPAGEVIGLHNSLHA